MDVQMNAYELPRLVKEGCQHRLGCRCQPPYWLRPSTPSELSREEKIQGSSNRSLEPLK